MGLFESKPAHPLADQNELSGRLAALCAAQPMAAVQQATAWLREAAEVHALGAGEREAAVRQLDDAAQPHARVMGRAFLTMVPLAQREELDLWRTNRDFWVQLGTSCFVCLTEAEREGAPADLLRRIELARLAARMMRAYAARLKWDQFRYWPASEAVWQIMGRACLFAQQAGFARREISAYHGEHPTTVEQEYLKALVFQVSATDALLPFEIEIADRLIARFLSLFTFSEHRAAGYSYWVDPAERRAPARIGAQLPDSPTLRFFTTAEAYAALERLRVALDQGDVPPELDLERYRSPRMFAPVVRHLAAHWGPNPPSRSHDRHRVQSDMAVVVGLPEIVRVLARPEEADNPARWTVENVSQGGLRTRLPLAEADSLPIGTLLGMRPAGGDNWLVGVVRRFSRAGGGAGIAGAETLTKHPLAVELRAGETAHPALLLDAPDEGETVRLVVPAPAFAPDRDAECIVAGASLRLRPVEAVEGSAETVLARYEVLPGLPPVRESVEC